MSKDLNAAKENQQSKEKMLSLEEQIQKGEEKDAFDGQVATTKFDDEPGSIEGGDKDIVHQQRKERRERQK